MGMDVYGQAPKSDLGEYFRANVWFWRPLWNYVCQVAPDVIDQTIAQAGHYNDGAGLDEHQALALAQRLEDELGAGKVKLAVKAFNDELDSLSESTCGCCGGTGHRTDDIGQSMGFDKKFNTYTMKPGWCNACDGKGTRPPLEASYGFDELTVRQFTLFLRDSGGFQIF